MLPKSNNQSGVYVRAIAVASFAIASTSNISAAEIDAVGPVDSIDCASQTVRVLGISFRATNATQIEAICSSPKPFELLYVAVRGTTKDGGDTDLLSYSLLSKGEYVPGATPVYLRGTITDTRSLVSDLVGVNGAAVSGLGQGASLGGIVEVLGTQPSLGGQVLATSARLESGILSSSGSGKLSSSGSGKLSSSGSGVLSSSGSGTLSSSGSGVLSSSGSGKLSSSGSGKLSSSGSGVLSSSGSGVLSSSGSGH